MHVYVMVELRSVRSPMLPVETVIAESISKGYGRDFLCW